LTKNKLVIGCGDKFHGDNWLHLDLSDLPHVDVKHDLETGELPFETNSFNEVRAIHILEHLSQESLTSILQELHRVTVPGGDILIVLPHFLSRHAADVDHYRAGSRKSFVQFCKGYQMNSPHPTLFEEKEINYFFERFPLVHLARYFLGDRRTARFLPNSVREIEFRLTNL
jgi:ubiquinone/menaquinone biosynthesis C-methylase UbiE